MDFSISLIPKIVCNELTNNINRVVNCPDEDFLTVMMKDIGLSIRRELLVRRHGIAFQKTCKNERC